MATYNESYSESLMRGLGMTQAQAMAVPRSWIVPRMSPTISEPEEDRVEKQETLKMEVELCLCTKRLWS